MTFLIEIFQYFVFTT